MTMSQAADDGWGSVLHPDDLEDTMRAWKECARTGNTWYRPGWGPEYCCLTNADYVALFHDGIYRHAGALGHF